MTSGSISYRRSPRALFRSIGSDVIVAVPDRSGFDSLSATAGIVWQLLSGPRTVNEVVEILDNEFAGSHAEIARDVERLLAELVDRGLVEEERSSDA